jgi:MFS family permease
MQKDSSTPETNTAPLPETGKPGAFAALRIPNYRLLFTSSILASSIQWIQQVVLSWLVYNLTGSGTILGTVNLMWSAGAACMLLYTGTLIDKYNHRSIMLIETVSMLAFCLFIGIVLLSGHANVFYLFVLTFVTGLIQTIDASTRQVMVFDVVPRSQTPGAMSLFQTGWSLMRVLGPTIGGFFIIWFTAGGTFLIQAGIFFFIMITLLRIKLPEKEKTPLSSSPLQNMKEGLSYMAKAPVTRIYTLVGALMSILVIPILVTLPPVFAVQVFGDSSGKVLGFLMAFAGIGGIMGGVMAAYLRRFERWGIIQLGSLALLSLCLIGFALTSNLPLALAILVIAGFFEIIALTASQTLVQLSIPDRIRGRVTAAVSLVWMIASFGSLIMGAGVDIFKGPQTICIIASCLNIALMILIFLVSPTIRNYRLSKNIETKQLSLMLQ